MQINSRLACILITCAVFVYSGPASANPLTGLDSIQLLKGDEWNSADTGWVNWIVVSVAPSRIHMPSWTDQQRLEFFNEFDPDHLDMWSGQAMNRGDFFRMRGTAVNSPMEYEYQELIGCIYGHDYLFKYNGVARLENSSVAKRWFRAEVQPPCMCNLAPFWHEVVKQGMVRNSVYCDSFFQDNIANPVYTWGQCFCSWCNRKFISYMKERFSPVQLKKLELDAANFNIQKYVMAKRKQCGSNYSAGKQRYQEQLVDTAANEKLLRDPVIHEYIRFQHVKNLELLVDSVSELKKNAKETGRPIPAFYGNIPRVSGMRAFPTIMAGQVDIVWTEESTCLQPPFKAGRQAWSALLYKTGRAAGSFSKPVISVQYHGGHNSPYDNPSQKFMPTALACSEALANGGVPCQTWVATEFNYLMKNDNWDQDFRKINRMHANFASGNRVLFTDRTGVAQTALVYSFPSTFWRQFQSLSVEQPHLINFTATARILEDAHIPYEVFILGHPDVFDDSKLLQNIDKYSNIIIPAADCISDSHAKIIGDWVRKGGNLVLLGKVGTSDEELAPRNEPVFSPLISDIGKGQVKLIDKQSADALSNGRILLPTSQKLAHKWNYTFQDPGSSWFSIEYDDSNWTSGPAPFASHEVRGTKPNTTWTSDSIWLRREFDLSKMPENPVFNIHHLWDVQIYVNGEPVAFGSGRGHPFESYQLLAIPAQKKKAFKVGKNIIALKCSRNLADLNNDQFIDIGIIDYPGSNVLTDLLKTDKLYIQTDLPSTVWLNTWRHGAGPMISVQMVNYDLDVAQDKFRTVNNFTVRLRVAGDVNYTNVNYFANDFSENAAPVLNLNFKRKGDYIEVVVPRLTVFGILTFSVDKELETRVAAANARKWFERLRISHRCLGASQNNVDRTLLTQAENILASIQGNAKISDFAPYVEKLNQVASNLEKALHAVTDQVNNSQHKVCRDALNADAVYKFDFGNGAADPNWIQIKTSTQYNDKQGYGWLSSGVMSSFDRGHPDPVHSDFIRNVTQEDNPELKSVKLKQSRAWPLLQPQNNPGIFRINLPNGHYVVTVITGDYSEFPVKAGPQNEGRTAMTNVRANGKLVLIGDRLVSGYFENRAFEIEITDGKLLVEFFGTSIGPLYSNSIEWLVNGLLIQRKNQQPTPAASAYLSKMEVIKKCAVRDWLVLGPYNDANYIGLDSLVGPESDCISNRAYLDKQFAWLPWHQDMSSLPCVPVYELLKCTKGVGFAFARIYSPSDVNALLVTSSTQFAKGYLNGQLVYRDELAAGLMAQENCVPVKLKKGNNDLLIKTVNHWGNEWSLWAAIMSPDRKPLSGLKIDNGSAFKNGN